ncbi:MAG: class II aldolase/adducin family protein [Betaproteobacteria bacterium]|jgi:ribulose-5-phosphate 4-epimerase/fuculose-1-phosphate aldolase|nr:class II aldolase/adducin family protein [Rhodocyclaceae bacterium]MCA3141356.1 class II aldolase/adducin family protein [Rhodocyclaceae bacterium]MCE2897796.1 class II aldolase/adducin family protein [Betaproteobacteria bacterium]
MHVNPVELQHIEYGPVPEGCSAPEWQTRVELAACYRLVRHHGWDSQVYNHITARIPGTEHILINAFGLAYDEIRASNLVKIDLAGNKVGDSPYPINHAGYVIHSAIHAARPDLQCVAHTHSPNAVALAAVDTDFVPLSQEGCQFHERVGYHPFEGIALDGEEKQRLVADLGAGNHTLVLRNHGVLVCGPSITWAWVRLYQFEVAAGVQLRAMAAGQLNRIAPAIMARTRQQFEGGDAQAGAAVRHPEWPAALRMLDRVDDSYRT